MSFTEHGDWCAVPPTPTLPAAQAGAARSDLMAGTMVLDDLVAVAAHCSEDGGDALLAQRLGIGSQVGVVGVRQIEHAWPFLYSVVPDRGLVKNAAGGEQTVSPEVDLVTEGMSLRDELVARGLRPARRR